MSLKERNIRVRMDSYRERYETYCQGKAEGSGDEKISVVEEQAFPGDMLLLPGNFPPG